MHVDNTRVSLVMPRFIGVASHCLNVLSYHYVRSNDKENRTHFGISSRARKKVSNSPDASGAILIYAGYAKALTRDQKAGQVILCHIQA